LHTALAKKALVMLTPAPTIADGPGKTLDFLFKDFAKKFDGVNLKLYSTTGYYLDADDARWGIDQWA